MKSVVCCLLVAGIAAQLCTDSGLATTLDFNGATQVSGKVLKQLICNAQTRIDFTFDQAASGDLPVTLASGNYYTFDDSKGSHLEFLNRDGKEWKYKLIGVSINPYISGKARVIINGIKTKPDYELSVTYSNVENNQDTVVSIFILKSDTAVTAGDNSVLVDGQRVYPEIRGFYGLVQSYLNASTSSKISNVAGGISYLNKPDLSQFYSVQTQPLGCGKKVNFLTSGFTIKLKDSLDFSNITTSATFTYTNNQEATGNRLCYGSQNNDGVFQTHVRESYPLWTAWFSVLLFWVAILFGEPNTISVYDKDLERNKWTSWEIYSLWHLANENFFSRIMRTTALFTSCWIICLTSAALYAFIGFSNVSPLTILYYGIGGAVAAFIYSFFSGFFLTGVSRCTLMKYTARKRSQLLNDKESAEAMGFQLQIDECEDKIFIYYYWFYIISIIVLMVCWTLSIHFMQIPPRESYYLMYYWVASVGVGFVLYAFILTPLWAFLCGDYAIAQIRGFWYDYRIGQVYREIQS